MKLFNYFCGMAAASPVMNMLVMKDLLDGKDDSTSDDNLLMMMMSPGLLGGNQDQADQMSSLLPLMLMDESSDDNNHMLMMMMMANGPNGMATNMDQMLPFLLMDDDKTDMKSLFLMTTMMQNNCEDTNSQINMLLPLLLVGENNEGDKRKRRSYEKCANFPKPFDPNNYAEIYKHINGRKRRANDENEFNNQEMTDDLFGWTVSVMAQQLCQFGNKHLVPWLSSLGRKRRGTDAGNKLNSNLKTLLLLQTMSKGNNGLDMNAMMPFLLMDDSSDSDNLMKMVLMSSLAGGMDSSDGFANNFNMLLPLLLGSEDGDKGDEDMLFILLAMQSQAPGSSMGSSAMLPLLMMSSDSNNQELIMFMAMMNNQNCAVPNVQSVKPVASEPETETIYRTWKINEDGTRTLVSEEETN